MEFAGSWGMAFVGLYIGEGFDVSRNLGNEPRVGAMLRLGCGERRANFHAI
jgi:hypothetical protein